MGKGKTLSNKYQDLYDAVEEMLVNDPPLRWAPKEETSMNQYYCIIRYMRKKFGFELKFFTFKNMLYIVRVE